LTNKERPKYEVAAEKFTNEIIELLDKAKAELPLENYKELIDDVLSDARARNMWAESQDPNRNS